MLKDKALFRGTVGAKDLYVPKCVTPTCLHGDGCRVPNEAGVDGVDSERIFSFWTQVCHHCRAHARIQINLLDRRSRSQVSVESKG